LNAITLSLIIFAFIFAGALIGMALRTILPERHLSDESRNMIALSIGIVATMAAITLGFLIEGAKDSFREQRSVLIEMSAKVIFLDEILADYGPETREARAALRVSLERTIDHFWPKDDSEPAGLGTLDVPATVYDKILSLTPVSGRDISLRDEALTLAYDLAQSRDTLVMAQNRSIPAAFLISLGLLAFWFIAIFFSFGLYAPTNATVVSMLAVSALSVAIALFIIMELNRPFDGVLRMPSQPLVEALNRIGR
jgi:hypothetical protein